MVFKDLDKILNDDEPMTKEELIEELDYAIEEDGHDIYFKAASAFWLKRLLEESQMKSSKRVAYILHKEFDCPLRACESAYDKAVEYLRSLTKVKGGTE